MVTINLLPWREMLREDNVKQRKIFLTMLSGLVLVGLISHLSFYFFLQTIETHIADLKNQFTELTDQEKQDQISTTAMIEEQIKASQHELIHFFSALNHDKKILISSSTIETQRNHIVIAGSGDSPFYLTQLVRFYNTSNTVMPITILNVRENADFSGVQFRLQLTRADSPFINTLKNDDDNS